jgi:hypothetical protein
MEIEQFGTHEGTGRGGIQEDEEESGLILCLESLQMHASVI